VAAPAQHCLTSREKLFFGKFRERGARVWPGGASPPNRSIGFVREKIFRNSGRFEICLARMRPRCSGRRLLRCDKPGTLQKLAHIRITRTPHSTTGSGPLALVLHTAAAPVPKLLSDFSRSFLRTPSMMSFSLRQRICLPPPTGPAPVSFHLSQFASSRELN
jgi:hypothetical protein